IRIESVPPGAEVTYDSVRLSDRTPFTLDAIQVGTRHEIKVELARHKPYVETIDIPKTGGQVQLNAMLKPITGKLRIITTPEGADIYLDGQLRGHTSATISDIDMATASQLELRLKDYRPYIQRLDWPANGEIELDIKLDH